MSVTIKANSYCPICRGIHLSDISHKIYLFNNNYTKPKKHIKTIQGEFKKLTNEPI